MRHINPKNETLKNNSAAQDGSLSALFARA
jgi:hypothetical protein